MAATESPLGRIGSEHQIRPGRDASGQPPPRMRRSRAQRDRGEHGAPGLWPAGAAEPVECECHKAITKSQRMRDNAVMISSTMPSTKYSCSGSPDMFWNGSTAIDGLSGRANGRATVAVSVTVALPSTR